MRGLEAGLAGHLASGETTLCTCWKLVRRDGLVLGFTDHDCLLEFGGLTYSPASGLDSGEAPARLGAEVATGEVLGILTDAAITEGDIALGRYDGAVVESWRVNWAEVGQRVLLRTDTIGESVREDGVFRAELRSPQQGLQAVHGRVYQSLCDAQLGDGRCGVDLNDPARRGEATVIGLDDPYRCLVSGLESFAAGWFAFGRAGWSTGKRADLSDPVMSHERTGAGDVLGFAMRVADWIEPGDTLVVTAGCDRRFATCRDRFGNAANFRGFPHIPGSDYVLRHPRNGDPLDGRAVVK
ncbi:DUF2163 domain-containing protein [Devosia sp. RR2S18]|uniref:DUF2163 domain-containing protein n=1 Tax=Devosia rhizosphaerae TaxID=3049774 RepID=UPI00254178DF|nr:DUF2163 domain-containing protein [Devosia sp. RR2S18]WIJ24365.1 DUF2163 domain-containing protein [Devosia sp. RR2S18]